jgi:hypothetical protein
MIFPAVISSLGRGKLKIGHVGGRLDQVAWDQAGEDGAPGVARAAILAMHRILIQFKFNA